MQILDDLYAETRRLFIAGSKFGKADPRILKYIPPLEKMGEKAPVMKKLAEKYTALTNDGQPEALADAGIFLYAVMATQSVTEVSGTEAEYEPTIYELPKTATPYSRMKPIIDALTLSMQGRYEILENAFKEGLLNDFRIYGYIAAALDDKYSAVVDLIYSYVIPKIGPDLIPYILEQYNPKGKQSDAMRLSLLDQLGYKNTEALAFEAIEEGSAVVAASGIKILGINPENESYLLTLANDKKAEIREAALLGLIRMDSTLGKEHMLKLLQGSKYKSAIAAAQLCNDTEYANKLLELLKPIYENLFIEELKDEDFLKRGNKFTELLTILRGKDEPEIYQFYKYLLTDRKYDKRRSQFKSHTYLLEDTQRVVCRLLCRIPDEHLLAICEEAMNISIAKKEFSIIRHYYHAAQKFYTDQQLYAAFSKYYEAQLIDFVEMFCPNGIYFTNHEEAVTEFERIRPNVSTQWKKLFIKKRDLKAMAVLLCQGDEQENEMREFILKKIKESVNRRSIDYILEMAVQRLIETASDKKTLLAKSDLEKTAEACYEVFEKLDKYQAQHFYDAIGQKNFLKLFSNGYAERFKTLVPKKADPLFKELEELLSL